jgi:type IV pilus assembly protein PilV
MRLITGRRPAQRGFSLIEVLIAVVVLSIGLLGIAALQGVSLRSGNEAVARTEATLAAYDLLDRIRANRNATDLDDYVLDFGEAPTGSAPAALDLQAWKVALTRLPEGDGAVAVAGRRVTVTVVWQDIRGDDSQLQVQSEL